MEVHLKPETEQTLQRLAAETGKAPNEFLEDAMASYLQELVPVREMLDRRYDEVTSGRVQPVDGEEALRRLRRRSQEKSPDLP